MDYETILNAIGDEPEYLFQTSRGSTYAHYPDNTTVRNRSGEAHQDPTVGLQPRSGKTIYMQPADVNAMAGIFQNAEIGTQLMPSSYDPKTKTGTAALQLMDDYGPKKAGSTIHQGSFTTVPQKGLIPVEINRSTSPVGSSGSGIHWGTPITDVIPRGAMPPTRTPEVGGGAGSLIHMMNPLKLAHGGAIDKAIAGNQKLI